MPNGAMAQQSPAQSRATAQREPAAATLPKPGEPVSSPEMCIRDRAKKGMGDPLVMRYFAGLEIDWNGYIRSRHALQGRGLPDGATDL